MRQGCTIYFASCPPHTAHHHPLRLICGPACLGRLGSGSSATATRLRPRGTVPPADGLRRNRRMRGPAEDRDRGTGKARLGPDWYGPTIQARARRPAAGSGPSGLSRPSRAQPCVSRWRACRLPGEGGPRGGSPLAGAALCHAPRPGTPSVQHASSPRRPLPPRCGPGPSQLPARPASVLRRNKGVTWNRLQPLRAGPLPPASIPRLEQPSAAHGAAEPRRNASSVSCRICMRWWW